MCLYATRHLNNDAVFSSGLLSFSAGKDCICTCLNLRSDALAELKVAFQCHKSLLNGFARALQG